MPGVQELQEVECLTAAYLTEDDPVWAVPEGCFQEVPDAHSWQAVMWLPGLKADKVVLVHVNFGGVFDEENSFVGGNEFPKDTKERCFPRSRRPLQRELRQDHELRGFGTLRDLLDEIDHVRDVVLDDCPGAETIRRLNGELAPRLDAGRSPRLHFHKVRTFIKPGALMVARVSIVMTARSSHSAFELGTQKVDRAVPEYMLL